MITTRDYLDLKGRLVLSGYGPEIDWAASVRECDNADDFACEAIWVVLNAGMKEQVARGIWTRIRPPLEAGEPIDGMFGHKLKVRAIYHIWNNREVLFGEYRHALDKLEFLDGLPHIGKITKYHLARNLGLDFCKPDRHLIRLALPDSPHGLCSRLSIATGDRIGLVDCVLWRSANLGWI